MTEPAATPEPERETWTAQQCADFWKIKYGTWTKYVSKGHAPKSLEGFDEQRRRRWDAETVRNYPRPGAGARTDLRRRPPSA